ncbi:hypothetical protein B0H19DRAFT_199690 [Mycena capillaripes]|nr:hypothetical protein B0H19DRAFT_199690 [Mycena capillaripes]
MLKLRRDLTRRAHALPIMLFAFGRSEGRYYIANGKRNYWKNVPNSLAKHLNKNHVLQAISFGIEDTWFFTEAPHEGTNGSYCLSSAAAVYYPQVWEIYQSDENINWVAFGPRGHYIVDTQKQLYHSDTEMVRQYEKGAGVPLRCASFGYDGAWVCVEDDGEIRSSGLSAKVQVALEKKAVRNVQLSANSSTIFFIEYVDGETAWSMPSSWSSNIESIGNISVRLDDPGAPGGMLTVCQRGMHLLKQHRTKRLSTNHLCLRAQARYILRIEWATGQLERYRRLGCYNAAQTRGHDAGLLSRRKWSVVLETRWLQLFVDCNEGGLPRSLAHLHVGRGDQLGGVWASGVLYH